MNLNLGTMPLHERLGMVVSIACAILALILSVIAGILTEGHISGPVGIAAWVAMGAGVASFGTGFFLRSRAA